MDWKARAEQLKTDVPALWALAAIFLVKLGLHLL